MTATILTSTDHPHLGPAVLAIGVFDGVHLGHQALIRDAIALAAERGARSCVLTFDRDPDQVVTPDRAAPQLMLLEDKLEALAALGPDVVLVVPFTHELAARAPAAFVRDVVCRSVRPVALVVGCDFRFGHGARGDVETLTAFGRGHSFDVLPRELLVVDSEPVTSSRIRSLIAEGRVVDAARLLGRPHRVAGDVVHGRGEGASLGAPTANVRTAPFSALPARGVYAAFALIGRERCPAAVSVGAPPSIPGATDVCEAHLIGYRGPSLYGERLTLEFVDRIRDLVRFESRDELAGAIASDVACISQLLDAETRRSP